MTICPYCGKEMKKGILAGNIKSIAWKEGDKGPSPIDFIAGIGRLTGLKTKFQWLSAESYFCKDCKRLIIDTDIK